MSNENQEYVNIELYFGDEEVEQIQLPKDAFLSIQQMALADDVTFEEKFLELLEEEMKKEFGEKYED